MSKKAIIISVCAITAAAAAGAFGMYKVVATPERVVELSLLNAYKDAEKSFVYVDDKEKHVIEGLKGGGKTTADITINNVPILDTLDISATVNYNTKCSASTITLSDYLKLETYKDDEAIYINAPVLESGFMIPVKDFAKEWNESIFKDMFTLPESVTTASAASETADGDTNTVENSLDEIKAVLKETAKDTQKVGTASVIVGSGSKKATAYEMTVTKENIERLENAFEGLFNAKSGLPQSVKSKFDEIIGAYNESMKLTFKIDNLKLRELDIANDDGDVTAIAFSGTGNTMDTMAIYNNGDTENAIRRTHSADSHSINETVTVGNDYKITFENGSTEAKLAIIDNGTSVNINGYNETVTDDSISFGDLEITVGDTIGATGTLDVSNVPDEDISFTKSGNYTDLLKITQEEWESILDNAISGITLLSGIFTSE